jgi:hypothetical protein
LLIKDQKHTKVAPKETQATNQERQSAKRSKTAKVMTLGRNKREKKGKGREKRGSRTKTGPPQQNSKARAVGREQRHTTSTAAPGGTKRDRRKTAKPRKQREGAKHGKKEDQNTKAPPDRDRPAPSVVLGVFVPGSSPFPRAPSPLFSLSSSSFLFFCPFPFRFVLFCDPQPRQQKARTYQAGSERAQRENPENRAPAVFGFSSLLVPFWATAASVSRPRTRSAKRRQRQRSHARQGRQRREKPHLQGETPGGYPGQNPSIRRAARVRDDKRTSNGKVTEGERGSKTSGQTGREKISGVFWGQRDNPLQAQVWYWGKGDRAVTQLTRKPLVSFALDWCLFGWPSSTFSNSLLALGSVVV